MFGSGGGGAGGWRPRGVFKAGCTQPCASGYSYDGGSCTHPINAADPRGLIRCHCDLDVPFIAPPAYKVWIVWKVVFADIAKNIALMNDDLGRDSKVDVRFPPIKCTLPPLDCVNYHSRHHRSGKEGGCK